MEIFFSNRIEKLYSQLKEALFFKNSKNPFTKKWVIVPSPAIKSWLMLEMAKDPDLKLAMGVEIIHLDQAVEKLISKKKLPSMLELSLKLEVEIKKMVENESDQNKWSGLFQFLKISKDKSSEKPLGLSLKKERRVVALSEKLANLFLQYGIYGGKLVSEWETEKKVNEDFQIELWKRIFLNEKWPYLINEIKNDCILSDTQEIHLFSISFLSKVHFDFLQKVSKIKDITYYFLSPCQAFWSDIQSEREHYFLKKYLKAKTKLNKAQDVELDVYLRNQNPLLANFGKLGKEMAKLIEESDSISNSSYLISDGVLQLEQYAEFDFNDFELENTPFTLLKSVQADLCLLRNPKLQEKIEFIDDTSIQVHVASSPMREIQILYDTLLKIMDESASTPSEKIIPSDIIVMAPDIMDYEPFIRAVFGSKDSLLDYHVMDLHCQMQNKLVQEFNHLLSLGSNRFQLDALMDLLGGQYFQKAQGFSLEDLAKIRSWLVNSGLRWGLSAIDREEILKNDHCLHSQTESSEYGTLNHCLENILASLTIESFDDDVLNAGFERIKVDNVQPTDAQLLGKFIALNASLNDDLKVLSNSVKMTLKEWASYFECLVKAYFGVDEAKENLSDDELMLLKQFDELRYAALKFGTETFSFYAVKTRLQKAFEIGKLDFQDSHLNSVRFCSMLPMRSIPSKVITLVGMNEGAFPRADVKNSLDLKLKNMSDYCPSKTDFDRYLFLETLLSARDFFLMSYSESSLNDKMSDGSLVVKEFLNYLDDGYVLDAEKTSKHILKKHPFNAFDKKYFESNSVFTSYSMFNHDLAIQYYNCESQVTQKFFPDFKVKDNNESVELPELVLDLKELSSFARNPIKTYFNKTLGIYLKDQKSDLQADEDFVISHLEMSQIKKASLKAPVSKVIDFVEKKGMMPAGLFKNLAVERIETDVSSMLKNLSKHAIEKEELFSIEFSESFDEPCLLDNGNWQLPCLRLNYQDKLTVKIVGSFNDVSKKGLLVHAKDNKQDVIKVWPAVLVFACLMDKHEIAGKNIIFVKCGGLKSIFLEYPIRALNEYLSYYFKGLKNVSPLIPEWVYDFIYAEQNLLENKIHESMNNDFSPLYNDYLDWLYTQNKEFNCVSFNEEWKALASTLYSDMYETWYKK